jgi:hypothetical protein
MEMGGRYGADDGVPATKSDVKLGRLEVRPTWPVIAGVRAQYKCFFWKVPTSVTLYE